MQKYIYGALFIAVIGFAMAGFITQQFSQNNLEATLSNQTNDDSMTSVSERPIIQLKTSHGDITIELFEDKAPKTVSHVIEFTQDGLYEDTLFHRVIEDFMIQGGDPLTKQENNQPLYGTGGPGFTFEDEINEVSLERGVVAMANSGPDTNGSQFFIITADETPWLEGKHTAFGNVIGGMTVVDEINSVETDSKDLPIEDVELFEVELMN